MAPTPAWHMPSQNLVEDDGRAIAERGIKLTSPISVRSLCALAAVVGDGWLPVAVTRRTVDPADKNVERAAA